MVAQSDGEVNWLFDRRLVECFSATDPTGLIERHDGRVFATAGDTMSDIDWDNVGDNLNDEGKDAVIAAAAGSRFICTAPRLTSLCRSVLYVADTTLRHVQLAARLFDAGPTTRGA